MEFDKIIPDWFGTEISNYITNSDMAFGSPEDIKNVIKNADRFE